MTKNVAHWLKEIKFKDQHYQIGGGGEAFILGSIKLRFVTLNISIEIR